LTSLFLTLAVVPAAYDLFDDGQEWLKRGEFKKLATPVYWKMRIRQIPELLNKIRMAPQAIGVIWTRIKQTPGVILSLCSRISGWLKGRRGGNPPD
jgi:hypothetical protein